MFKKTFIALLGVVSAVSFAGASYVGEPIPKNYYAMTAVVSDLDYAGCVVTVENANGFSWCFSGTEDWIIGDVASLIMDGKGTETILDDEIVSIRYSGYIASDLK